MDTAPQADDGQTPRRRSVDRVPELWGTTEIAAAASVTTGAVANWRRRHIGRDAFPRPVVTLAQGPVWIAEDVRGWLSRRDSQTRRRAYNAVAPVEREHVEPTSEG